MTSTQGVDADIAETNAAWQHDHLHTSLASQAREHFGATNIPLGYPIATTNPVPEKETFKSGLKLNQEAAQHVHKAIKIPDQK